MPVIARSTPRPAGETNSNSGSAAAYSTARAVDLAPQQPGEAGVDRLAVAVGRPVGPRQQVGRFHAEPGQRFGRQVDAAGGGVLGEVPQDVRPLERPPAGQRGLAGVGVQFVTAPDVQAAQPHRPGDVVAVAVEFRRRLKEHAGRPRLGGRPGEVGGDAVDHVPRQVGGDAAAGGHVREGRQHGGMGGVRVARLPVQGGGGPVPPLRDRQPAAVRAGR